MERNKECVKTENRKGSSESSVVIIWFLAEITDKWSKEWTQREKGRYLHSIHLLVSLSNNYKRQSTWWEIIITHLRKGLNHSLHKIGKHNRLMFQLSSSRNHRWCLPSMSCILTSKADTQKKVKSMGISLNFPSLLKTHPELTEIHSALFSFLRSCRVQNTSIVSNALQPIRWR